MFIVLSLDLLLLSITNSAPHNALLTRATSYLAPLPLPLSPVVHSPGGRQNCLTCQSDRVALP